MPLNIEAKKAIIRKVITNQDYRDEVSVIIDEIFLDYCISFFKKVIYAKLDHLGKETDWYREIFLNTGLPKDEIVINSGLNMKSVFNSYGSTRKEVVIKASENNYLRLSRTIKELIETNTDLEVKLTIKFKDVSVDLTPIESLIVLNTIAVKRAAIRGGQWSSVGKQIEKPLMIALCKLFNVPFEFHNQTNNPDSFREVDFYVLSADGKKLRTEVRLMGQGNPESGDAIFAREPDIFLADKLGPKNIKQAVKYGIQWVELRSVNGYKKFQTVLEALNVPHSDLTEDFSTRLEAVLKEIYIE